MKLNKENLFGRLMPQAKELEELVLGACLIEKKAIDLIDHIINADDFYDTELSILFGIIKKMKNENKPIDIATVYEYGIKNNLDINPVRISSISSKIASTSHIEYHAQIIKQKSILRNMIKISTKCIDSCYNDDDIIEVFDVLEKEITGLKTGMYSSDGFHISDVFIESRKQIEELCMKNKNGDIPLISTGLNSLDKALQGGFMSPDLIVLAARPSMGKTQHSLSFAKHAALQNKSVCYVSLEMSRIQLVNRLYTEDRIINPSNLRSGKLSPDEFNSIEKTIGKYWDKNFNIADGDEMKNISNIKSYARNMKRRGLIDIMIIDYLGYIRTNMNFRERYIEVGYITSELKSLAKELDIPIILLAQLKRGSKTGKQAATEFPSLEDLRESGNIEQDADIILFIHKPDYYDPDIEDSKGMPWKNSGMLIIGKFREGQRMQDVRFYHCDRYKVISDLPQTDLPF